MMHRPIGAHSHRPLATVDVFELLRVICRKLPAIILPHLYCPYIRPTGRYRLLRSLMFNVVVITVISTTTQVQSDIASCIFD